VAQSSVGVVLPKSTRAILFAKRVVRVCVLPEDIPITARGLHHMDGREVLSQQLKDIEIVSQAPFYSFCHNGRWGIFGLNKEEVVAVDAVVAFGSFPSIFLGLATSIALTHAGIPMLVLFQSFQEGDVLRSFAHIKEPLPDLLTLCPYDDSEELLKIVVPFIHTVSGALVRQK